MIGIWFSVGSIFGPFLGGLFIELFPQVSFFYLIVTVLLIALCAILMKKEKELKLRELK